MSLKREDIDRIANLARLTISDEAAKSLAPQLKNILKLIDELNEANTAAIDPLAHPLGFSQPMRTDEITEQNQREKFQKEAPCVEEGLYIVPQVIEDEA